MTKKLLHKDTWDVVLDPQIAFLWWNLFKHSGNYFEIICKKKWNVQDWKSPALNYMCKVKADVCFSLKAYRKFWNVYKPDSKYFIAENFTICLDATFIIYRFYLLLLGTHNMWAISSGEIRLVISAELFCSSFHSILSMWSIIYFKSILGLVLGILSSFKLFVSTSKSQCGQLSLVCTALVAEKRG